MSREGITSQDTVGYISTNLYSAVTESGVHGARYFRGTRVLLCTSTLNYRNGNNATARKNMKPIVNRRGIR
jgi:hypothetical protein